MTGLGSYVLEAVGFLFVWAVLLVCAWIALCLVSEHLAERRMRRELAKLEGRHPAGRLR